MQEFLSSFCFGDFYTRNGLDLKTRELLTLCIISSLGGAEGQVKA
ncbi:carboxymuconolactone decarboxylase family protein, partial [Priestia megaterium]